VYGELPWLAGECMEVGERCCAAAADDSDAVKGLWGGEGSLTLAVRRLDRGLDEGLLAEMAVRRCQQTVVEPL